jgi:hypothetical protein
MLQMKRLGRTPRRRLITLVLLSLAFALGAQVLRLEFVVKRDPAQDTTDAARASGEFASRRDTERRRDTGILDREAAKRLAETWGIEVEALRITSSGHFVDFRYRVLDRQKATVLMDRQAKPVLTRQGSGSRVRVPPTVGRLRRTSSAPGMGRHYFMLFPNPGRLIRPGDRVTIERGAFRLEHLVVEGRDIRAGSAIGARAPETRSGRALLA